MTKLFTPLMLAALLSIRAAFPAFAAEEEPLELGDLSCAEFSTMLADDAQKDSNTMLMLWIDGYLSGVSGDTAINWQNLAELTAALKSYCGTHPRANLLETARKFGIEK